MLAVDTEDDSEGTPHLINFFDGREHTTFEGKDCQLKSWDWLSAHPGEVCWACNLEYDLLNLFGGQWVTKLCTLTYITPGLLKAVYKMPGCSGTGLTFYDTLRHWPISVEGMGSYLGLPKLKQDFHSVEYCRRDTEIVWRFVDEMLKRYECLDLTPKATLPSMALQLLQKTFYLEVPTRPFPDDILDWLRQGYYGGRVEVYRMGEIAGPIHHYDVNSLYPSMMAQHAMPDVRDWVITDAPRWEWEGMADCLLSIPEMPYPPLPVRTEHDIMYPVGPMRGVFTYPEIRAALKAGATVLTVWQAIECRHTVEPFKAYVTYCYQERMKSTSMLDTTFWKLMLNSLYGKFGQKGDLVILKDDQEYHVGGEAGHVNVLWSAYVTAYARLHLWHLLQQADPVYYTDTDSVFTPTILPTGPGLGALKEEGTYDTFEAYGNKLYMAGGKARAKGVPVGVAGDFLRTGRAIFRKPARLRESRRTGVVPNKWYEVEKELKALYTKRRVLPDGSTMPWTLKDYRREVMKA